MFSPPNLTACEDKSDELKAKLNKLGAPDQKLSKDKVIDIAAQINQVFAHGK